MDINSKKFLSDILQAIQEIESFFNNGPKLFSDYCECLMLRRAVERNIGIIGEAVNQLFKIDPEIEISHIRNIRATRNRIIHSYDSLRPELIWAIVINDLPVLKKEVEFLLAQNK